MMSSSASASASVASSEVSKIGVMVIGMVPGREGLTVGRPAASRAGRDDLDVFQALRQRSAARWQQTGPLDVWVLRRLGGLTRFGAAGRFPEADCRAISVRTGVAGRESDWRVKRPPAALPITIGPEAFSAGASKAALSGQCAAYVSPEAGPSGLTSRNERIRTVVHRADRSGDAGRSGHRPARHRRATACVRRHRFPGRSTFPDRYMKK